MVVGGQLDRATATHFIRGLGGGRGRCLGSCHSCKEKVIDNCSRLLFIGKVTEYIIKKNIWT